MKSEIIMIPHKGIDLQVFLNSECDDIFLEANACIFKIFYRLGKDRVSPKHVYIEITVSSQEINDLSQKHILEYINQDARATRPLYLKVMVDEKLREGFAYLTKMSTECTFVSTWSWDLKVKT
ncbi:MAG: hypothetical protein OXE55_01380 [Flavobacteriaceae bacterium]|nr:hypothetical protein [Flavobacteriaceae bacterium]